MAIKMVKFAALTSCTILLFVAIFPVAADGQMLYSILSKMDERFTKVQSFKANIKLTEFEAALDEKTDSSGEIQFLCKKDQDPYFRIDSPGEVFMVAAGKYFVWTKRNDRAHIGKIDSVAKENPGFDAISFVGISGAELPKDYTVKYLGQTAISGIEVWHLQLVPKGKSDVMTVELWIENSGIPVRIKVMRKNKDSALVRLGGIRKGEPVDKLSFKILESSAVH